MGRPLLSIMHSFAVDLSAVHKRLAEFVASIKLGVAVWVVGVVFAWEPTWTIQLLLCMDL